MGAQQKPDEVGDVNTALAITKEDKAALTPAQRAAIAVRKNANIVAAQMAGTNWGKGLDTATQRAVADWGQRNGVDVTTEIFVLGGNIYLNAQLYMNRGIDLINAGKLLDYRQRFIHHDPRLEAIVKQPLPVDATPEERTDWAAARSAARQELRERQELRIKHAVPEDAAVKAAVLTEIILTKMPHVTFCGVKWAPHPNAQHNDPVGTHYPQESALTRSARRAWKQAIRQVPEMLRYVQGAEDDAEANVEHLLKAHHEREQALAAAEPAPESRQLAPGGTLEEMQKWYRENRIAEPDYVTQGRETAPKFSREQIAELANGADPYATPGTEHIPTPFDPPAPEPPAAPTGPATETLFGTVEPMEPTAEEKAAHEAEEDEAIRAEERRLVAEEEALEQRRARRK